MNISFENKVALVTGAGSGLGLATAKAFAKAGASVALADRNEEAAQSAANEIAAKGRQAIAIRCDVSDDAQVAAMVKKISRSLDVSMRLTITRASRMCSRKRPIRPARITTA